MPQTTQYVNEPQSEGDTVAGLKKNFPVLYRDWVSAVDCQIGGDSVGDVQSDPSNITAKYWR